MMKWAIAVVAGAALAVALHWAVTLPPPRPPPQLATPMFVQIVVGSERMKPPPPAWYSMLTMGIAALTAIGACALALLILLRTTVTPATRRLAAALALASFAGIYSYFIRLYPQYAHVFRVDVPGAWTFVLDFASAMAAFGAAYLIMRFFQSYPREPTEAEWRAHYEKHAQEVRQRLAQGWRRWLYPGALVMRARSRYVSGDLGERMTGASPTGRGQLRRFFASPWILVLCLAIAGGYAAIDNYGMQVALSGADRASPAYERAMRLQSYAFSVASLVLIMMVALGYEALKFHHHEAVADDRAKIDWIYGAGLVFGLLAVTAAPLWWAAAFVVVPWLEAHAILVSPVLMLAGPFVVTLELFMLGFVAALALSIFYRGAIDPRLAARRVTFFGVMSILITFLFVLLERAVTSRIVAWLGSPPETGILIAGAVIAATFHPIRERTEKVVNVFVARFLPLDSMAEGERKVAAVVMSDLAGYAQLSDRDDKQALLLGALLQRQAQMVADELGGRVLRSTSATIVMAFHDAGSATQALAALHGRFGPAAKTLGLTPLEVRSGAHIGEVTQTAEGAIHGQAVDIAARLQSLAEPGQRVVSEVFANSAQVEQAHRRSLGVHRLKNVAEPMACVELS